MRDVMRRLVNEAIVFECHLPHVESDLARSSFSTQNDTCFRNDNSALLSELIYNNIVEYANNEYDINYQELDKEQLKALKLNLRYNADASDKAKISYGFYGEVLLYSILQCKFKAGVLISKGYFYNPLERSEAKGYDTFHLIERNNRLELWFGEAKFYKAYKKPISDIITNLDNALSDKYFERNILAIINERAHITTHNTKMEAVISEWLDNPEINIVDQINKHDISMVYPMFVAFEQNKSGTYHDNIKNCINHIAELFNDKLINIPATFKFSLFFMFLPVDDVKKVKEAVVEWITSKKPLI